MFVSFAISQALLLAIALHAALIGSAAATGLWRALPEGADSFPLRAFFALALGLALQMALLFVLGVAGGFSEPWLLVAGAAAGALALAWLVRAGGLKTPRVAPAEIAVAVALYALVASTAARAPGYFDDTMYHLPLARFYAETQGLGLDRWVRFPLFPQNMELLFALAFALRPGDVVLAQGCASLPAFIIALGLVGAGRWLRGSWVLGVGASVAFLAMPVVDDTLGYAYIDIGLAMFCFAVTFGAVLFGGGAPLGVYFALGILGGAAAGCKIHGLVAAALAFAALAALRAKPAALAAFAGATALLGCGWYLRSYILSGDPISPAGGAWFGYFLWDANDLAAQRGEQAKHGVGTKLYKLPKAFIKAGAALVIPALLAPLVAPRRRAAVFALWATFLAYSLFWFYSSQVERYLAPVFAIGILLSLTFVYDALTFLSERFAPRTLPIAQRPAIVAALVAVLLVGYGARAFPRAHHELRKWEKILDARPGYVAFQQANALASRYGSRLVQVGFEGSIYFYEGVAIGDWFGAGRYHDLATFDKGIRLIPAARMRETLARFDAKLLAVNLAFASFDEADYRTQFDTIMNDGKQALLAVKDAL